MAELVTASQFQLVPDAGKAIRSGQQIAGQFQTARAQSQAMEQAKQKQEWQQRATTALELQGLDSEGQVSVLRRQIAQSGLAGEDSPEAQEMLGLIMSGEKEKLDNYLSKSVDIGQRMGVIEAPAKPEGFTSVQTRGGVPSGIKGGVLQPIPTTPEMAEALAKSPAEGIANVQSSKTFPGGLVQLIGEGGQVVLVEPSEAERKLIEEAELRGAKLQGLRSGERRAAAEAQVQAISAFKKITSVRKGIRNLEEGIKLIDEGAETGAIASKFPSMRAASVKLDNVQAQLGLDVIGNTTFGALSESELQFALSSAIPKKLDGPELKKWLQEKRDVQVKLADYLNDAAIFLGTPGNTVADFLRTKRDDRRSQSQQVPAAQPTPAATQTPQVAPVGRFTVEIVQ